MASPDDPVAPEAWVEFVIDNPHALALAGGRTADQLHVTAKFLGDANGLSEEWRQLYVDHIEAMCDDLGQLTFTVEGVDLLGPDRTVVSLLVSSTDALWFHGMLNTLTPEIEDEWPYNPHVALAKEPDDPDAMIAQALDRVGETFTSSAVNVCFDDEAQPRSIRLTQDIEPVLAAVVDPWQPDPFPAELESDIAEKPVPVDVTGPPADAVEAALLGLVAVEGGAVLSIAGVEVADAIAGKRELTDAHIAAMAGHPYEETDTGLLFGGAPGRAWAVGVLQVRQTERLAAVKDRPKTIDWKGFSRQLQAIDHEFTDRTAAVLGQSMRSASRRARRKLGVRVRKASGAKLAACMDDLQSGAITAAVLDAARSTMDELLDESFTDAADQVVYFYDRRVKRIRRLLVATFPAVTDDYLDASGWSVQEDKRRALLLGFVVSAMTYEATARLRRPVGEPLYDPQGEQPSDPTVPMTVVRDVTRIARGGSTEGGGDTPHTVAEPVTLPGAATPAELFNYTDDLVDQILEQVSPAVTTVYEWECGDPMHPFPGHHGDGADLPSLCGLQATNETYFEVFAKDPADFPFGNTYWLDGDHPGCECNVTVTYSGPTEDAPPEHRATG